MLVARHAIVAMAHAPNGEMRPRPALTVSATSAATSKSGGTIVTKCTTPSPVNHGCRDGPWNTKYQIAPRSGPRSPWKRRKKSSERGTNA